MSEESRKIEINEIGNDVEVPKIKSKKPKHNSKRRRSKKNQNNSQISESKKVDEIVNFLCDSISNNESELSLEINAALKVTKESQNIEVCNGQNCCRNLYSVNKKNSPSTSYSDFNNLFQNLQVKTNSPTKANNTTKFFNISLLKKANCESLCIEDLQKLKQKKSKKFSNQSKVSTSGEQIKEYFNMDVLRKSSKKPLKVSCNKPGNEFPCETENFGQKIFLNSEDISKQSTAGSSNGNNSTKQQGCSKHSSAQNDNEFPKDLSAEELQSLANFGVLLSGVIRINQKNYKEAYITDPDKGTDILIDGLKDRNRALEGDEVYFVLKPKEHHRISADSTDVQRTAVVVGIKLKNHNRGAIGTLNININKNNKFAVFSPRDPRLPRIRIQKNNWPPGFSENPNNFKTILYYAKITQWTDMRFADGEIVKEVGLAGEIETETEAILLHYDLEVAPYSEALKLFLPPPTYKISKAEINGREDLRNDCIFTIDPKTASDLDDAVSCKMLPNGNYEVGVHISDVSHFLLEGTPLDCAVSNRATTVYLVQKAYHMLPYELCRLCSLTPGEDKLAFSVFWEINADCEILNHRFTRSIINSCAQFSYDQVQSIISNSDCSETVFPKIFGNHCIEKIKEILFVLHKIATFLKFKRYSSGALKIEQLKIRFLLDENMLPLHYNAELHEESHQLIEELMLLANITVAERLCECFPKIAFLRSHSPPLPYMLEKVQTSLEKYGIILDISNSRSIQSSILQYSGKDIESVARMLVLSNAIAKPMTRARYYCSGLQLNEEGRIHYALNVALYTHFTSPIRRYADVMTHRLLAASLGYCNRPSWTMDYVQRIAANCNKQKQAAKMAGETSTELFLAIYIEQKGGIICEAVVCDIKDRSFDCIGLSTGFHHRVYFEDIKGQLDQAEKADIVRLIVRWPKDDDHATETIQIIDMFSIVKVKLKRVGPLKIEAKLLRYD